MLGKAEYWLEMANDSITDAKWTLRTRRLLNTVSLCNLALEKALKAHVTFVTGDVPPYTHDLIKLAKISGVYEKLREEQKTFLIDMIPMQTYCRYQSQKDAVAASLNYKRCKQIYKESEALICFLKTKLEK